MKKYTGREDELPIDAHGWLALVAPRRCLLDAAYNDDCDPTFGVERAYLAGREVYRLLGRPDNLRVIYRSGGHDPITAEHRRRNLDWFDLAFGRGKARQNDFPEEFFHQFDWREWKAKLEPKALEPPPPAAEVRARVLWALGQPPAKIPWDGRYTFLSAEESAMMGHDRWAAKGTTRLPVSFGANVRGNVYYKTGSGKLPTPAVIWLHPYSYPSGYNEAYGVEKTTIYHRLAAEGFVVLAFDQCGFGLRLAEGRDFYQQYPAWSRLGRMVHDVRAAVDFLSHGRGDAAGEMPQIQKKHVYVLGYSLGGMVGLYAAALDGRIAGAACFDGFTPLRSDAAAKPTGGNRRLWQWHALQPLLGLYDGREADIPHDFDDLLGLIAPRPCLVFSSRHDRHADFEDVTACIRDARQAWPDPTLLTHVTEDDISRFQRRQQDVFLKWLHDELCRPRPE